MLTVIVPVTELFNEKTNEFSTLPGATLHLEHSLVSFSKWESFFEKPFLREEAKTDEETRSYIRMMCLDPDIPPGVFSRIKRQDMDRISTYIGSKQTATWFNEIPGSKPASREVVTAELIYYWMIQMGIPWEAQEWHLNRLLTLIKVCSLKNSPQKKMTAREVAEQTRALNEKRRQQYNTRG